MARQGESCLQFVIDRVQYKDNGLIESPNHGSFPVITRYYHSRRAKGFALNRDSHSRSNHVWVFQSTVHCTRAFLRS
jgi:hypothetical protein